jgi:hypothetical protein
MAGRFVIINLGVKAGDYGKDEVGIERLIGFPIPLAPPAINTRR